MPSSAVARWGLVLLITVISGLADAQGFLHAAEIWRDDTLSLRALARSAAGFAVGISLYYVGLRLQNSLGVRAPEVQTASWFAVTLIGVAVASGRFTSWRAVDQAVAVMVLLGIGWLMFRVPG